MADTYQVNIEAKLNFDGMNVEINTPVVTGTPAYKIESLVLATGNNSFTVPATADNLIILPDPNNVGTYKLKGNSGDTGVSIMGNYHPILLNVNPGDTIILTVTGIDLLPTKLIWF
jgi:hypothetical protein